MIISITIATLILNLSLIQFLYNKFEEIGLQNSHEFNRKLNTQLTYNFDYMNEIVKNLAVTQFFDPANVYLMQSNIDVEDNFNSIRNLAKLQDVIANNAILHSVVIYNNKRKEFYTIDSNGATPTQSDLKEIVNKGRNIPVLSPIPRLLADQAVKIPVFSYFLFESVDHEGIMDSAIILNVKMEWLSNNLKKFMNDESNFVLVDAGKYVLLDARNEFRLFDSIPDPLFNVKANQSVIISDRSGKQVVTKLSVSNTEDWHLISISSYQTVFGFIAELKRQTFLVTCSAFIIAVLVSLAISKLIYRPIGILVQRVRKTMGDQEYRSFDDTEYLSHALQSSIARYHEISVTTKELIRENVLKSLLTESHFLQSKLYKEHLGELRELFHHSRALKLIIFVIDQNKHYRSLVQSEKQLVKFSFLNIANEVLGEYGVFEKAYLGNGEFVYLLVGSEKMEFTEELTERIKTIQSILVRITKMITISAMISPMFDQIGELYNVYSKTRLLLNYRISKGNSSILNYDSGINKEMDDRYPIDVEAKITYAIKRGKVDEAMFLYQSLADDLRASNNNHLIVTMVSLALSVGRTVQEINVNKMEEIKIDFNSFYSEIVQAETLDEINEKFQHLFGLIERLQKKMTESKHQVIINSVIDYIQLQYAEADLSLKQIAAEFKMSQGYLGQLFRETCNKSVGKYINDVRMEKVLYLLRSTDWSVRDIAVKTGYLNEANFYKVFKKEFGVTPNEYRTSKMLANMSPGK